VFEKAQSGSSIKNCPLFAPHMHRLEKEILMQFSNMPIL